MAKKRKKVIINFITKPLIFNIEAEDFAKDLIYSKPQKRRKKK